MDDILERIAGTLEPIADIDWMGKWRIKSVIEMCQNKHPSLRDQAEAKVAEVGYGSDSPGYEACVLGAIEEIQHSLALGEKTLQEIHEAMEPRTQNLDTTCLMLPDVPFCEECAKKRKAMANYPTNTKDYLYEKDGSYNPEMVKKILEAKNSKTTEFKTWGELKKHLDTIADNIHTETTDKD